MKWIIVLSISAVLAVIGSGIVCVLKQKTGSPRVMKRILKWNMALITTFLLGLIAMMVPDVALAAETGGVTSSAGIGLIGAALSTGMACLGAGYAVGAVGSSALGAISEDSSLLGKTLIFVGLAEGIAIYGLIISIMILQRV